MRARVVNVGVGLLIILLGFTVIDSPIQLYENVHAGTPISEGNITSDTTWTAIGSPYWIDGNLTIENNVNLTIEPDVEVRFTGYYSIYVAGYLEAVGTPSDNILFTSDSTTPARGDWNRIQINSTGRAEIEYCQIHYGRFGIYMDSCSNINITYSTFSEIEVSAIFSSYVDTINVSGNDISYTGQTCIYLEKSSNTQVIDNTVFNNDYWAIYLLYTENNTLTHNNVHDNHGGVAFHRSPNSTVMFNLITSNNLTGFHSYYSANFTFTENEINSNGKGILEITENNYSEFKNNTINNNSIGVSVSDVGAEFLSNMTGNMVNGKNLQEFYFIDQTNLVFNDLYLDSGQSRGYSGYATGQGLLSFYNCTNIEINNCGFNYNHHGIYLSNADSVDISSNNVSNCYYGIFSGESSDVQINNNKFSDIEVGLYLYGTTDHMVSDNNITGNASFWGINLENVQRSEVRNNIISNFSIGLKIDNTNNCEIDENLIHDNEEGLKLSNSFVNLTDNQMYNNTEYGLSIPWDSRSSINTMSGNVINGYDAQELYYLDAQGIVIENRTYDSRSLGYKGNLTRGGIITLYNCHHFEIKNCVLNGNYYGIYLYQSSSNQMTGNSLKDNNQAGIYLYSGSNYNNISYSTIYNSTVGLAFSWSNLNNIKYCNIINLGYAGISFWGCGQNNISFSNISHSSKYGICAYAGSNVNILANCVLYNNSIEGLFESPGNQIYHNNIIDSDINFTVFACSVFENYWSDYTGLDDGSDGRTPGDGIGDTELPHLNIDNYPLMEPIDHNPPSILSAIPSGRIGKDDVLIQVIFDETMNTTSVENAFSITDGKSIWNMDFGTFIWSRTVSDNDTMTFIPSFILGLNTTYTVQIDHSAKDLDDYLLDGNSDGISESHHIDDYTWSFTTKEGSLIHLVIDPVDITCWLNDTFTFSVYGYDTDWNLNLSWTLQWSVDNDIYANIDPQTGLFTPKMVGSGTVTVTCIENTSIHNFTTFNIVPWPLHHLEIIHSGSTELEKDQSGSIDVIGWNDVNESQENTTWLAQWTSSDNSIIEIEIDTGEFITKDYGQAMIRVEDEFSGIYSELVITVIDTTKPVSDAGDDLLLTEGTEYTFNGENCTDNDVIAKYEWTIENGMDKVTLWGKTPTFIFKDPGTYTITLNVTDPTGNWDIDNFVVTVLVDTDFDGIPNIDDEDDDNDGHPDNEDAFPLDDSEWQDFDGDELGDNADSDDDNDGIPDDEDDFPLDPNKWQAESQGDFMIYVLFIVVIVIVILILVILFLRQRKGMGGFSYEEPEEEEGEFLEVEVIEPNR